MRPKTLQSRLNCLNYAENRRFISYFDQKKKANVAFFRIKNHDSINIYGWDYSKGGKKGDFFKISVQNLRTSEKDEGKS